MNKKILEISESEYVSLFLNNLIIKQKEEKIIIPINNIEVIILENERTNISIPVINELVDKKVNIIFAKIIYQTPLLSLIMVIMIIKFFKIKLNEI